MQEIAHICFGWLWILCPHYDVMIIVLKKDFFPARIDTRNIYSHQQLFQMTYASVILRLTRNKYDTNI